MKNENFSYEIVETIAVLSRNGNVTKELNRVIFNGYPVQYDIRRWSRNNGEEKLLKGITLTDEETRILKEALNGRIDL